MSTRSGRTRDPGEQHRDRPTPSVTRYDLVLALVPTAFLLAAVATEAVGASLHIAFVAGSLLSAAAVTDALFLHPPTKSQ
ncbi:hypothetical protein [Haloarcula nitratireducens]|uniref:Uncharacterized protein n=1 Tax=Haloarcula nitratireducens TaxID=2487749 RepID=A0AAW4PA96_9EURY|nr:hypothetical protein [Halomicroarcula nitratireducens]MBX0294819.1 hypothetical protein [Halomicroarcula nitratireducens]